MLKAEIQKIHSNNFLNNHVLNFFGLSDKEEQPVNNGLWRYQILSCAQDTKFVMNKSKMCTTSNYQIIFLAKVQQIFS